MREWLEPLYAENNPLPKKLWNFIISIEVIRYTQQRKITNNISHDYPPFFVRKSNSSSH